jgi:peptidoglycan/xylan/chitin deacetylase (PgdA/CDA1 family)
MLRHFRGRRTEWVALLYHRVSTLPVDPWGLAVTPRHFEEQLAVIREIGRPTRLADLDSSLRRRERPRSAVVVTFDDGYADNLHEARPLLKRYDIPATMFITTGPLSGKREFWWDELERGLLSPGTVPAKLCLTIAGRQHAWDLGESAEYASPVTTRYQQWRAWHEPPTARHACFYELWQLLQRESAGERERVLNKLRAWSGHDSAPRTTHRTVSSEELVDLGSHGLIEIGAHAVTHSALSALSSSSQRDEIHRCKIDLEAITGGPVTSFAYPFGRQIDYTAHTVSQVREAGFARACSAVDDRTGHHVDRFQIPRVQVHDLDGDAFRKWLRNRLEI